jgi:hypothetical protein
MIIIIVENQKPGNLTGFSTLSNLAFNLMIYKGISNRSRFIFRYVTFARSKGVRYKAKGVRPGLMPSTFNLLP